MSNYKKEIFVFGSNLMGIHGSGSARYAKNHYGAVWGVGEGLCGDSYALPTKVTPYQKMPLDEIKAHVEIFLEVARNNPTLKFRLTKVGTNRAGYEVIDIAPMFAKAPENVVLIDDMGTDQCLACDWWSKV